MQSRKPKQKGLGGRPHVRKAVQYIVFFAISILWAMLLILVVMEVYSTPKPPDAVNLNEEENNDTTTPNNNVNSTTQRLEIAGTATQLVQTINAMLGIDPSYTPRPLVIFMTETTVGTPASSTATANRNPSPHFSIRQGEQSEGICVYMEPRDFWVVGDEAQPLSDRLAYGARIVIDASLILTSDDFYIGRVDTVHPVFDSNRQLLGSYGGTVWVCFKAVGLEVGVHTARIEVKSGSDKEYSYTWKFRIDPLATHTPSAIP